MPIKSWSECLFKRQHIKELDINLSVIIKWMLKVVWTNLD
jgi:hypothetical protein